MSLLVNNQKIVPRFFITINGWYLLRFMKSFFFRLFAHKFLSSQLGHLTAMRLTPDIDLAFTERLDYLEVGFEPKTSCFAFLLLSFVNLLSTNTDSNIHFCIKENFEFSSRMRVVFFFPPFVRIRPRLIQPPSEDARQHPEGSDVLLRHHSAR